MTLDLQQPPRGLTLKDGRSLSYQIYGAPAGQPSYFFHGFPGCRLQAALTHDQAVAAGLCLVAFDRPGFGRSSPHPSRSIVGVADDVAQLADHLGHARFGTLGVSCGGPYALACAQRLPARVRHVGLLAGIGPMDVAALRQGQLPVLRLMFSLARVNPALISPLLLLDRMLFRSDPERAVRALSPMLTDPDRRLLDADPELRRIFAASLAEAYYQGIGGAQREAALIAGARGYALEEIFTAVDVFQSGIDRNVPPAMGRHLAERLPNGRLHPYPDEGHLSIVVNGFADYAERFLAASP